LLELLVQLQGRKLQQPDRLLQLGRQRESLGGLEMERGLHAYCWSVARRAANTTRRYIRKCSPRYTRRTLSLSTISLGRPEARTVPALMIYARSQIPSVSRTLWSVMRTPIPRFLRNFTIRWISITAIG